MRCARALDGRLNGIGDRVEMLPDRVQVYTADGEQALQQVHALGIPLESAVVRRSTLEDVFLRITGRALSGVSHARVTNDDCRRSHGAAQRARLPARLARIGLLELSAAHAVPARDGLGLGAMVDAGGAALPGGVSYAEFLAPGLLAAAAMQVAGFESTYPVLGKMMWHRNYEAIMATPMRVSDLVLGELAWMALRLTTIAAAFVLVMTAFGIPRSPLVLLAIPAAVLTGLAFAAPDHGVCGDAASTPARSTCCSASSSRRCSCFPACSFPISRLPEPLAARGVVHAAVSRRRARPRRSR